MPLYEYSCEHCQIRFETIKTPDERDFAPCPKCGHLSPKIMSPFNFTFGWTLSDRSHERFGPRDEFVKDV